MADTKKQLISNIIGAQLEVKKKKGRKVCFTQLPNKPVNFLSLLYFSHM